MDGISIIVDSTTGEIISYGGGDLSDRVKPGQEAINFFNDDNELKVLQLNDDQGKRAYKYDKASGNLVLIAVVDRVKKDKKSDEYKVLKDKGNDKEKLDWLLKTVGQVIGIESAD